MNSRERTLTALAHREADRVPFDLGGTGATGIHLAAYQKLRRHLGLPSVRPRVEDVIQQLAVIDDDVHHMLGTDMRNVAPRPSAIYNLQFRDEGDYSTYEDEWGIGWRMPKEGGFYYDMYLHPLTATDTLDDVKDYHWPDAADPNRFVGLCERARAVHEDGKIVVLAACVPASRRCTRGCVVSNSTTRTWSPTNRWPAI